MGTSKQRPNGGAREKRDTKMGTHANITTAIARIAAEDKGAYMSESVVAIIASGKVTRLDLHNILSYLFDDGHETALAETAEDIKYLANTFARMDKAAAFGIDDEPLVYFVDGSVNFSVTDEDTEASASWKRAAQKPSTHDHRFTAEGTMLPYGSTTRKA